MWEQIFLAIVGISIGITVAGGLFAFIIGLGIISDFADRTHTGECILLYEDSVALGGILGNIWYIYGFAIPGKSLFLTIFGLFSGIFVGCWSMALAEMLNLFPIFIRRAKVLKSAAYIILGMAIGKGVGAFIFFWNGW